MVVINGKPKKFEGVLILYDHKFENIDAEIEYKSLPKLLNNTYNILQLQANISKESLKTKGIFKSRNIRGFCEDITTLQDNCSNKSLSADENFKRNVILEGVFLKICYCMGVIFIFLSGKHFLKILVTTSKKSNRIAPLT